MKSQPQTPTTGRKVDRALSIIFGLAIAVAWIMVLIDLKVVWIFMYGVVLLLWFLPAVKFKDAYKMPPWEIGLILLLPILFFVLNNSDALGQLEGSAADIALLLDSVALGTIGFLMVAELELYTELRMNRGISVMFVTLFTMAVGSLALVVVFISDLINYDTGTVPGEDIIKDDDGQIVDTPSLGTNDEMMEFFEYTLVIGLVIGIFYAVYTKLLPGRVHAMMSGMAGVVRKEGESA